MNVSIIIAPHGKYAKYYYAKCQCTVGPRSSDPIYIVSYYILYVQEVVTLQKKIINIFASENEVHTICLLLRYFRLNIIRLQSKIILGHKSSIG